MPLQVRDLESEKSDLDKTINDMKVKFELAEKQAEEQKEVEEKKHSEEIQFLKRTNQQLKVCRTLLAWSSALAFGIEMTVVLH